MEEDLPDDISIVSRFSAMEIEDFEELKKEPKNMKKMTSKHSMDIRVENLKAKVDVQTQKYEKCSSCASFIPNEALLPGS